MGGGLKVRCSHCGRTAPWEGNPYRPFCSERCKLVDLGHWLAEDYRLPVPEGEAEETLETEVERGE